MLIFIPLSYAYLLPVTTGSCPFEQGDERGMSGSRVGRRSGEGVQRCFEVLGFLGFVILTILIIL